LVMSYSLKKLVTFKKLTFHKGFSDASAVDA
jgi:hypothetical protein